MKDIYQLIKRPLITEKSNISRDQQNQVTFEVDRRANKLEIKRAVEAIFKVKVLKVRTLQVAGKVKRMGRNTGKRPNWKKAMVTLNKGEKIDFFEGV
ncbi:MAG: 50S ribosomal protein L23 [Deltaproteobacteria bacterium]|nr:MAG: 50S ribosomal protein L23 [Deltaproteobacteria bacterium]